MVVEITLETDIAGDIVLMSDADDLSDAVDVTSIDGEINVDDVEDTQLLNDKRALNDGLAIVVVGDRLCVRDESGDGLDEEDCHDVSDFNGEVLGRLERVTE